VSAGPVPEGLHPDLNIARRGEDSLKFAQELALQLSSGGSRTAGEYKCVASRLPVP
jgi:hypothetical protein